jgi:hypothetical protein
VRRRLPVVSALALAAAACAAFRNDPAVTLSAQCEGAGYVMRGGACLPPQLGARRRADAPETADAAAD